MQKMPAIASLVIAMLFRASGALSAEIALPESCLALKRSELGVSAVLRLDGSGYSGYDETDEEARFILKDALFAGRVEFASGPVSAVSAERIGGSKDAQVTLRFRESPQDSVINFKASSAVADAADSLVVPASTVVAAYAFKKPPAHARAQGGSRNHDGGPGEYKLPKLPLAHYSDALVSLKVQNADFREVLWLLSEIGQVSIVLDPYWDDEPTGFRRTVGGGAGGDTGGEGGGAGFRSPGDYGPRAPRNGGGNLTLNFTDVPFDLALDMVIEAVGLVKLDIGSPEGR